MMVTYTIDSKELPSEDVLRRVPALRDEDIVYNEDCPALSPKMEKALACGVA